MDKYGSHIILEFDGCSKKSHLEDEIYIKAILEHAACKANATIIKSEFHQFEPFGVSGVVVIAESHITIHTWPEHDYAAIDIFTCSDNMITENAVEYLINEMQPKNIEKIIIERGINNTKERYIKSKIINMENK